jgi:D-methionine transport system permease protein
VISILGASAVAGIVGAGGLGAVALTYGYQNFNDKVMYGTVLVIIILVQMIQTSGNFLYRKLK